MVQKSAPFDGEATLGDDGAYSSAAWWEIWSTFSMMDIDNLPNIGVLSNVLNELEVQPTSPASANIQVQTGAALVQGNWFYSDAIETKAIVANATGSDRHDLIILELNLSTNTTRLGVVTGASPSTDPALTQTLNTLWQIPLARVVVPNGFSTIGASDIEDMRAYANTPNRIGFRVQNKGTITLKTGYCAIVDTGNARAVDDSTVPGGNVLGVISGEAAVNNSTPIIVRGLMFIPVDTAVSIGDKLSASNTTGRIGLHGGIRIATALESGSAGDYVPCWVDAREHHGNTFDYFQTRSTLGATVPDDCLLLYGQTIGDAGSGADVASSEMRALYTFFWDNLADAQAPVSTGRGASAAADFDAGKTLTVPDMRGRVETGKDDMGGSSAGVITDASADILADVFGAETHTLTQAELPLYDLSVTSYNSGGTGAFFRNDSSPTNPDTSVISSGGSDDPHNNVQPSMTHNKYVRK